MSLPYEGQANFEVNHMEKKPAKSSHPRMLPDESTLSGTIAGDKLTLNPSPDALTSKQPIQKPAK